MDFVRQCVIPSYTYIFLKYDNTYRILDMKQYMGINELKRQLLQIYDFFDAALDCTLSWKSITLGQLAMNAETI